MQYEKSNNLAYIFDMIELENSAVASLVRHLEDYGSEYAALLFKVLSKKPQYIDQFKLEKFFSIEDIEICNLKETNEVYFVGENGEGKTLLFWAIYVVFAGIKRNFGETSRLVDNVLHESSLSQSQKKVSRVVWEKTSNGYIALDESNKKIQPILAGKDSQGNKHYLRNRNRSNLVFEQYPESFLFIPNFYAYGANRSWIDSDREPAPDFASLFSHEAKLYNPVRLLETADRIDKYKVEIREKEDFRLKYDDLKKVFERLMEDRVEIIQKDGTFKFKEKNYEVDFYNLSEGYRNILIWVGDMLTRLQKNNPEISDIREYQAVVLVDEIDLHLHPRWQVNFVRTLRDAFPKIQFLFTTHSPIMLQGAGDDAVFYRVYRNAEGHTEVSEPYYKKDMHHMMFNTLMTSPLFGMDSARLSPETEDADTSISNLRSEIDRQVRAQLDARRKEGITYISDETIAELVRKALEAEMNK